MTRPELSFDGRGINGPDIYRSRIATFDHRVSDADAKRYGRLFEAAPDLHAALWQLMQYVGGWDSPATHPCGVARDLLERLQRDGLEPPTEV